VIYKTVTGKLDIGTFTFMTGAIALAQLEYTSGVHDVFDHRRSGDVHHRPFGLLQPAAARVTRSRSGCRSSADPSGIRVSGCFIRLPRSDAQWCSGNVSFKLEPTERIALVGENGQGKTTIVKLLTRLYDPTGGRILLDGVDLRDYQLERFVEKKSGSSFRISCGTT